MRSSPSTGPSCDRPSLRASPSRALAWTRPGRGGWWVRKGRPGAMRNERLVSAFGLIREGTGFGVRVELRRANSLVRVEITQFDSDPKASGVWCRRAPLHHLVRAGFMTPTGRERTMRIVLTSTLCLGLATQVVA